MEAGGPRSKEARLGRAHAGSRRWPLRVGRVPRRRRTAGEFNPARGWVASANETNLPEGYPHEEKKVGFEWYAPYRYERIAEVLRDNPSFGLEDSAKLQADYLSVPARRIVARLRRLRLADPELEETLEMLNSWDCVLSADSAPAALFEVWYCLYLRQALLKRAMEGIVEPGRLDEAVSRVMPVEDQAGDARMSLETLEKLDTSLGHEAVDEVLSSTCSVPTSSPSSATPGKSGNGSPSGNTSATFVGHGTLMIAVMGFENKLASDEELDRMKGLL